MLIALFFIALGIGYYFDYKKNVENYHEKDKANLYIFIIVVIAAYILYLIIK